MQKKQSSRVGFALPTVLIASVVMLTVLTVSVSSVVSVRTALLTQYYEQIAKTAGEAGVAYAKACLSKNGNVPLWSDAKPLRPSTDCAGNETIGTSSFSALIVAGGGSGGGSTGGGGGGGGVIEVQDITLATGSYTVSVGGGGAIPGNQAIGRTGANSSFNGLIAYGGGGGSYSAGGSTSAVGLNGGSGGGGQVYHGPRGPGSGTSGQGFDGGSISGSASGSTTGGGGAGGPGFNSSVTNGGGAGGPGKLSTLSGAPLYYGGGGGGGASVSTCGTGGGAGGVGGGGAGGDIGTAGQINTGGGGGGGWCYASGNGGAGGSGIVIIRYPNNGSVVASGGNEVYVSGMYKIHKFTSVGNSTFTLTSVSASSCPTDPRCSVMVDGNLRSSFSVGQPTLDSNGRAVAIPNSGYVDLLRESNGQVWRTYRQPTVQAAVVPDLCSGAATSSLGWSRAVETTAQSPLPNSTTAKTITQVNGNVPAGLMYFRKDFPVTSDGTYSVIASTPSSTDKVEIYVDGVLQVTAQGAVSTNPVSLSAGCHTVTAKLDNITAVSMPSQFTAAIQKDGATSAIVETNADWRVSSGMAVHYSSPEFDADPSVWSPVIDYTTPTAQAANASWQNVQSDIFTRMISSAINGCNTACPPSSSTYLRDSRDFVLDTNTEVIVSAICDDNCSVYIDGQEVLAGAPWNSIGQQTLVLTEGVHRLGVKLYNAGSAGNPAGAAVSVTVKTGVSGLPTGTVLARTDRTWTAANVWTSGTASADIVSYEKSFLPSPDEIARPVTFDLIVVGGGGGGGSNSAGGGGGGGLIYRPDLQLGIGTYNVVIGGGGGGAPNSNTTGSNGGTSSFGSYSAAGGGGGASRDNGSGGLSGASGGGGSGTTSGGTNPGSRHVGGNGTNGQGFAGGNGTPADLGIDSKGGGGGGAGGSGGTGVAAVAGNGGAGFITFLTGGRLGLAGGGGGTNTAGYGSLGAGADGGTNGNSSSAAANTGGGGGGGAPGSNNGGSGTVIIRVKTGSATVTTTGSPSVTPNVTIGGVSYTIYRFNANGSFRIVSLN